MLERVLSTLLYHCTSYKTKLVSAKSMTQQKRYEDLIEDFEQAIALVKKEKEAGGTDILGTGSALALDDHLGTTVIVTKPVGSLEVFKDKEAVVTGYSCILAKCGREFSLLLQLPHEKNHCGTWANLDDIEVIRDRDETVALCN